MSASPPASAVVTVGDELLFGESDNSNQRWMLETLQSTGRPAGAALCLPDDVRLIARWLRQLRAAPLAPIFISGGIGGTHDDHTREGIAAALGVPLTRHEECFEILAERYGERFNPQRQRMAWLPEGSRLVANPIGAPGFAVGGVYAFPGFPSMLQPMMLAVLEELADPAAAWKIHDVVLPVAEGEIAQQVEQFAERHPSARVGIYPSASKFGKEVTLRLRCAPTDQATAAAFEKLVQQLGSA